MRGIKVLNVDLDKQTAIVYDFRRKPLSIGTDEFNAFLNTRKVKEISVDLKSDWELTLFTLHKGDHDEWIALNENVAERVEVGRSQDITMEKILEIDDYFESLTK